MSAIFLERDRTEIVADMFRKFECEELPAFAWRDRKEPKERQKKRALCMATLEEFERVLEQIGAPRTRQEAIDAIYPQGFGYVLMWLLFRAMVAQIVGWLWDRTQA
jgi:hypothetical protein